MPWHTTRVLRFDDGLGQRPVDHRRGGGGVSFLPVKLISGVACVASLKMPTNPKGELRAMPLQPGHDNSKLPSKTTP